MNGPGYSQLKRRGSVPGIGLEEVVYSLRRHKGLILCFSLLGILAAVAAGIAKPPRYVSEAKLLLHYASEVKGIDPKETAILSSLDLATQVVAIVGAEKILSKNGGGDDPENAVEIIALGTEVSYSNAPIVTLSFQNHDREICQPVLEAIIHAYMLKHLEVYTGPEVFDEYWVKDLGQKLAQADDAFKKAKLEAGMTSAEDSKPLEKKIIQTQQELAAARRDLAQKQQRLKQWSPGQRIADSTVRDYTNCLSELEQLEKQEHELLWRGYKETHPLVQKVRGQLRNLSVQRAQLEMNYPGLTQVTAVEGEPSSKPAGWDRAQETIEIDRLSTRVISLASSLTNLQAQAVRGHELAPKILELQLQRDHLRTNYDAVVTQLAKATANASIKDDNIVKISIVQNPTPPLLRVYDTLKLAGSLLAGCIGFGIGLAFFLDRALDRSIKGSLDVERYLHLPIFLAIPDTSLTRPSSRNSRAPLQVVGATNGVPKRNGSAARIVVRPQDQSHSLGGYAVGLRERVWTYFEIRGMDLKQPKLVGVTGCGRGTGVSTIASGLAAELSKSGEGNVLLVDVSGEKRPARSFYLNKPSCPVTEVLQPQGRAGAQVRDRLYVACLDEDGQTDVPVLRAKRFNSVVPKLKASDYDYIVFDMPPVSTTSPTPRLAAYLDLTLLILEPERTQQKAAIKATELMWEARANVTAVLNKCCRSDSEALAKDL